MPAGTGPAGLGTPVTTAAPPNGPAGSRYINPATRDYQIDPATNQFAQMPQIRQQVLLAITTVAASASAAQWLGIKLPRKMGNRFQAECEKAVRFALRHLTETQRLIRIDSITAVPGRAGRAQITVSWTEIATGKTDTVTNS